MISSPSKARATSSRSRSFLVVSTQCIRSSLQLYSRKNISTLLLFILLLVCPLLFYFSLETPKDKHERPEDLSSPSSLPPPPPPSSSNTSIIYSNARKDRSGAAFQDMLMAHAYAWRHNLTYNGACSDYPAPNADKLKELLQAIGLDTILKFACPDMDTEQGGRIIKRSVYYRKDTALWTAEWRSYIRSRLRPAFVKRKNVKNTIAIHIRRGDVRPCDKDDDVVKRYLPNQHYLRLLDHYYAPVMDHSQVVIYSQSESFESWSDFASTCTLRLDTDNLEVWRGLLTADNLILSKSSLSLVAGLLSSATQVVYTPFWHQPLANWTVISRELEMETLRDLGRIKRENCYSIDDR